uniref:Ig-like domain-containing protein n=1 Tax=Monopterus albus TaxID=43700 RepID=A0A3Q3JS86_MONAL
MSASFLSYTSTHIGVTLKRSSSLSDHERHKIVAILVVITINFIAVFGPYHLVGGYRFVSLLLTDDPCGLECSIFLIYRLCYGLTSLNTLLDPLFYIFLYGALLYANLRSNVTLPCFYASSTKYLFWYKQAAGEQPQKVSSFYKHLDDSNNFHSQFREDKRFSVHIGAGFYHLIISDVQDLDSAMYYCGQSSITGIEFVNGTFLVIKVSSSVQPGGSVTLNCTVHTGTSDIEHSVYWFRQDLENSHLGIMYVHVHSSSQCVKSASNGSPEKSCVYSLPKRNVKLSDAGVYHCAVASCGQILFGKGTRLDVEGEQHMFLKLLSVVSGDLCSVCTANIKLMSMKHLHFLKRTNVCILDSLQYVALEFKKRQSTSRRPRSTKEEMVYSGVRLSDLE